MPPGHLIPLGSTGWHLWKLSALRSAGFRATDILLLTDPHPPADTGAYPAAAERASQALARCCRDPRFREAVAWQNPQVLRHAVDPLAAGPAALAAKWRKRELKVARYLQRYTTKNDSIGFFGPCGWATWEDGPDALRLVPGRGLLARRTVYFESWAIDAVADALARDPGLLPWLRPRPSPQNVITAEGVRRPDGSILRLSPDERRVLDQCDGDRPVREIAPDGGAEAVVEKLRDRGILQPDLRGPIEAHPERTLLAKLGRIADPHVRDPAITRLRQLTDARDRLAAASGDADAVHAATTHLDRTFERITQQEPARRPGQSYAGRSLAYEDTVRDVRLTLGRPLLDQLAAPLGLLLDSARWLAAQLGDRYHDHFRTLLAKARRRTGEQAIPLADLVGMATPDIVFSHRELPRLTAPLIEEFQRRWARVLRIPPGASRHHLDAARIRDRVAAEFPRSAPRWAAAVHHAPDLMIAAESAAAINDGRYLLVLGELHVGINTLSARPFVEQQADPGWLRRASERDHGTRRVIAVPSKESAWANSRTYPPALTSPLDTFWTMYGDPALTPDGGLLPAADLHVHERDGTAVVRAGRDGREFPLLEVMGEYLSGIATNAFAPVAGGGHRPRVTVDRLVISRERWAFPVAGLAWAFRKDPAARFVEARRWRAAHRLPERAFYRVETEDKPIFVDFGSTVLVSLLAQCVRCCAGESPDADLTLSEMLPGLGECWLADAAGGRYTAELRLVAVDEASEPGAGRPR
ncbi:lantibiotic dehydratase [Nonomuraea monospora]|uniref:Lantibiotic dehydratase n=1 Tax=Nonomuraea monospora TaxID=568818 RepID=A0ABN3CE69_9ACTN